MALRLGHLPDSRFGARLLGKAPRLAVASPAYLARRGTPQTPADLARHDCILGPGLSGGSGWSFTRSGRAGFVTVDGPINVASADGVVACAKAGPSPQLLNPMAVARGPRSSRRAAGAVISTSRARGHSNYGQR